MEPFVPQFEHLANRRPAMAALFSGLMAVVGVFLFWGFTVDDALISARVAHQIATGHGYRFNASGPVVDAVTPLGWAYLLAPFARHGPMSAFQAARWIGVSCWVASAAWLGASVVRRGGAVWPLALLALISPLGFWSSAGMETATVVAFVTLSTARGTPGLLCAGAAAAWRPELIPFAFALTVCKSSSLRQVPRDLAVAIAPAVAVALLRWGIFGAPYPLAVVAKPSTWQQGVWYALEALLWSGPLWLWLSPGWPWLDADRNSAARFWHRLPGLPALERPEAAVAVAVLVHFFAIALAGGDWMPAYRLAVPVMPVMLRVACLAATQRGRYYNVVAALLALTACVHIAVKLGPRARHVVEQRRQLIDAASGLLSEAKVVAAPDVGWVGAAFSEQIVDLAGATDAAIANLRGGHTSKRIESRIFISRKVDRVVVLLAPQAELSQPWTNSAFARAIDYRAAQLAAELGCNPVGLLPIAFTAQRYLVLACPNSP